MRAAMTRASRTLCVLIAVLAVAGIVVSGVSLQHHFAKSKTNYCDFGENFNCDTVNRSTYSTVFGIPDALIGIVGYAALLGFATFYRDNEQTPAIVLGGSLVGLSFALYLTYIEAYVLATWCILCLSSLTLISLITLLSAALMISSRRRA